MNCQFFNLNNLSNGNYLQLHVEEKKLFFTVSSQRFYKLICFTQEGYFLWIFSFILSLHDTFNLISFMQLPNQQCMLECFLLLASFFFKCWTSDWKPRESLRAQTVGCWTVWRTLKTSWRAMWLDRRRWCRHVCAAGFSGDTDRLRAGCPETQWSWTRRPCLTWRRPTATRPPSAEHACTSKEDTQHTNACLKSASQVELFQVLILTVKPVGSNPVETSQWLQTQG